MRLSSLYNRLRRRERAFTAQERGADTPAPRQTMTLEAMTRGAQTRSIKPGMRPR
ncbi:hypothetical protein QQM79_08460 [Marinobacteraceae bacterium S3BR75-40.1]